jgi:hypothetical protein
MIQAGKRFAWFTGLCVIGVSALVLYSCGDSGGGGSKPGDGGGGGGTAISSVSEGSQAAAIATDSVLAAVSTVGSLGFTFTKPMLGAYGKTLPVPGHDRDPRLQKAAEIRAKKTASKGMQKKIAFLKSRLRSKTALAEVVDEFWQACDNYDGSDGPTDSDGPNGTTGYYRYTDTYDDVNFVPETFEGTDVNCQFFDTNLLGDVTGGTRFDGTFTFGQTNYDEGPGPNEFSADYSYTEHGLASDNDPYIFESYENTTNATNVTDLRDLTRTLFFESSYEMSGSFSGTSVYDDNTGEGSGETNFNLSLGGMEHFGVDTADFTFNFDNLTDEGVLSWDDAGFFSADYEDHTEATLNGGFAFDFSADVPAAKPAASVNPLATVSGSLSVSFTDMQFNEDYTEDATGYDDLYDLDGQVTVDVSPADVCFEGTFDISTPERIHETSSGFCPIDGTINVNDNTTVKFNNDESVDVTVDGDGTHYDDCTEVGAACSAGSGLIQG